MILQKIKNFSRIHGYILFCALALISVLYLYYRWHINKDYLGIVETKSHVIGIQEPGKIQKMFVQVGDAVKEGQVLATLDVTDLKFEIAQLQDELNMLQEYKKAQQDYSRLEFKRKGLQLENEAFDLSERLSLLESKKTEMSVLNDEIQRLVEAQQAGLGYSRDLADLKLRRDALASYLREQSKELQSQSQKLTETRMTKKILEQSNSDSLVTSSLLEPLGRYEELRRSLNLAEHRVTLRTMRAPCDGYVVETYAYEGDVVKEFDPVLSVAESKSSYLTVYLPERFNTLVHNGMKVEIHSPRSKSSQTSGVVSFIHPGFTRTSDRLSFRGQLFWARMIRVELNKNHALLPGEIVYARLCQDLSEEKELFSSQAHASETIVTDNDVWMDSDVSIQDMQLPDLLQNKTQFEPSAIVWIEKLKRYLILSDDTGKKDKKTHHSPWMFLMNAMGDVEPNPVELEGIETVNDLEAITQVSDDTFYFLSSQNISKRGKRPQNREMLLKVKYDGHSFKIQNKVALLSLILDSYSSAQLKLLGLDKMDKDGRPVLNIEGMAYNHGTLYLGLKEPIGEKGAIFWKLSDPESVLNSHTLLPGQLSLLGYINLDQEKMSGISDMTFNQEGKLYVLSTIPNVEKKDQRGGLYCIESLIADTLNGTLISTFPGLKPEGICFKNEKELMIVFDRDEIVPSFCTIDLEKL